MAFGYLVFMPIILWLGLIALKPVIFQIGFVGWILIAIINLISKIVNKMNQSPIIIKENVAKDILKKMKE